MIAAILLTAAASAYLVGWLRLRQRRRSAVRVAQLVLYLTALAVIALALFSPLGALAARLLTAHMIQHAALMMAAAPLLLLANPLPVALWAIPPPFRQRLGRCLAPGARLRGGVRMVTLMPVAWALSMTLLWGWHLPVAYDAALRSDWIHDVQHVSFFAGGLLFWWPLIDPAPRTHGSIPYGWRLAYVMVSVGAGMLPGIAIGLFARRVFYRHYLTVPRLWGLNALDDQAMAWGLMAVMNGLVYGIALLLLVAAIAAHEERVAQTDPAHADLDTLQR